MKLREPHSLKRGSKAREMVGVEAEQPLEFDLQRVVTAVSELGSPPPYRSDYEFLLGLAGPEYFEQLRPGYKQAAAEMHESLETTGMGSMGNLNAGQSKLFDSAAFAQKGWDDQKLRGYMGLLLKLFGMLASNSWLHAVQLLVLFPDEHERILRELRPAEAGRLNWIVNQAQEKPNETMAWLELAALRLVDPENTDVERVTRKFWIQWNRKLEELLKKAESAETDNQKKGSADAALGLAISLYILSAEKAVINDQGLSEIVPAKKGIARGPELPERSAL